MSRAPVGLVGSDDYQAAEKKFGLSHQMLEVCLALGFPVPVLERSPLVRGQYGISDRLPRPIIPGDKRALNKQVVEVLVKESIENVGPRLAEVIEGLLNELLANPVATVG